VIGRDPIVIIGAGQCGASAAAALRSAGFDGDVILVGEEPDPPYERPPLSKGYLMGSDEAGALTIKPDGWYAGNEVELLLDTRAERILSLDRRVELSDGRRLPYDRLLIATGGRPRRIAAFRGERVRYLRTRADADRLTPHLDHGNRLVIVGAGFIGCEVAAVARQQGAEVTILEMLDVPLVRALDADIGQTIATIHRESGVDLRTSTCVESIEETSGGVVVSTDTDQIECDVMLVAVGIVPNVEVAHGAGLELDDGIVVDEHCRTNVQGIFAAGDVARHFHPLFGRPIRVEHYDNAIKQGTAAANNMLGISTVFDDAHWFWSDQYDHSLQSVGDTRDSDQVVDRGDIERRSIARFYLRGDRVQGLVALNRPRDVLQGRKLVQSGTPVEASRLADESLDLRELLRRPHRRRRPLDTTG
jgi:3-phenylpropionate/trans-cinnamate dioxygenase ferredoxin reductase component